MVKDETCEFHSCDYIFEVGDGDETCEFHSCDYIL